MSSDQRCQGLDPATDTLRIARGSKEPKMADTTFRKTIIICWDDEQQAFIADAPDLPSCTGSGATYEEALASVRKPFSGGRSGPGARGRFALHRSKTPEIFSPTREWCDTMTHLGASRTCRLQIVRASG